MSWPPAAPPSCSHTRSFAAVADGAEFSLEDGLLTVNTVLVLKPGTQDNQVGPVSSQSNGCDVRVRPELVLSL